VRDAAARMKAAGGRSEILAELSAKALPLVEAARREDAEMEQAGEEDEDEDGGKAHEEEDGDGDEDSDEAGGAAAGAGGPRAGTMQRRTIRYADGTVIANGTLRLYRGGTMKAVAGAAKAGTVRGPQGEAAGAHRSEGTGVVVRSEPAVAAAAEVPSFLRQLRKGRDQTPAAGGVAAAATPAPAPAPSPSSSLTDEALAELGEADLSSMAEDALRDRLLSVGETFRSALAELYSAHRKAEAQVKDELARRGLATDSADEGADGDEPADGGEDGQGDEEEEFYDDDADYYVGAGLDADSGVAGTFRYGGGEF